MSETSSEASSRDSKEGMIPEEEEHGDRDAGTAPADGELSRGLLTDNQASSLRDRGESNEDSDSSAVSSDEDSVRRYQGVVFSSMSIEAIFVGVPHNCAACGTSLKMRQF